MGSHTLTCTPQPHTLPSHITWLESQQALQVAKAQVMQLWDQPWALPVLTLTWSSRAAEWATLELVQAGNQEVLHPITNPLSHKSPKSLMVWKPDAVPLGTAGMEKPSRCHSSAASTPSEKVPASGTATQGYKVLK